MKLSKLQKDHFEKQTHKSFWKKENIFNQMQARINAECNLNLYIKED